MSWKKRIKNIKSFFSPKKWDSTQFSNASNSNDYLENNQLEPLNNVNNPKKAKLLWNKRKNKRNRGIFFNFKHRNTIQIIKYLESKNIYNAFFYTDINNVNLILEQGIRPTSQLSLLKEQEYTVWTYLEHPNYLELELGNSTRHFFWKWCSEQQVEMKQIAIISIDVSKLFEATEKDWGLSLKTNRLQIYEIIPVKAIEWILVKDKKVFRILQMNIETNNLDIKIYYGDDGQLINDIKK